MLGTVGLPTKLVFTILGEQHLLNSPHYPQKSNAKSK
jgi:hypothetical protein